jgi:HAD superfamily hydrolase (TIGR01662 family)
MAVLGGLIERGSDHRDPLRLFRPGIDFKAEFASRQEAGVRDYLLDEDLYPDAVPALGRLVAAGYRVGIVGNQPIRAEALFTALDVPLDFVASSESWGVQKPDPAFFARIAEEVRLPPEEIAYVGDRLDNDVRPAAEAGMAAIFIRRGPWAWIQAGRSNPPEAAATIEGLDELEGILRALDAG